MLICAINLFRCPTEPSKCRVLQCKRGIICLNYINTLIFYLRPKIFFRSWLKPRNRFLGIAVDI